MLFKKTRHREGEFLFVQLCWIFVRFKETIVTSIAIFRNYIV